MKYAKQRSREVEVVNVTQSFTVSVVIASDAKSKQCACHFGQF